MTNRPKMRRRRRRLRQVLAEVREAIFPTEMHIPETAAIPFPAPEVFAKVADDVAIFGIGFHKELPDRSVEYIDPKEVVITKQEPEKPPQPEALPEGVVMVSLLEPQVLHETIAEAVGEKPPSIKRRSW